MSDIEARARAYAISTTGIDGNVASRHYLAGARAEVELERKRILAALINLREDEIIEVANIKKIIEGDGI